MGRIFEVRKHAMFARWDKMAKNFTRIGKEIAIEKESLAEGRFFIVLKRDNIKQMKNEK